MDDVMKMRYAYDLGLMDGIADILTTMYETGEYEDYNLIKPVYDEWLRALESVEKNPLNDCGHRLSLDLYEWLYSLDVIEFDDLPYELRKIEEM